ncbi:hypothetical protein ACP3TB_13800 [Rahnella variigena]|uniref:hypothetical protein n=1 Tax=Rahnella variigena TaxID=574964 RepID=UPI003CF67429
MEKEVIQNDQDLQPVLSYGPQDNTLLHLVTMANHGISSGITLLLEGAVVYGDLMPGLEFCNKSAENIRNGGGDSGKEPRELLASFFDDLANSYKTDSGNVIPLNYLHLKNVAHLRGDGGRTTTTGGLFRISIEKVAGFSIGRPSY